MKYFTIKELSHSDTAVARGIDNTPTGEAVHNLTELVENVLDPLREKYGKPIRVSSGYRSAVLNRSVNGATSSQAADITVGSKEGNRRLFEIIRKELPFDQLIDEKDFSWVHVSFRKGKNRKQVLKL